MSRKILSGTRPAGGSGKNVVNSKIFTVVCGIAASLYNSGGYFVANIVGGVGYQYLGAQDLFMICSVACFCCTLLTFVYSIFLKYSSILESNKNKDGSNLPIV